VILVSVIVAIGVGAAPAASPGNPLAMAEKGYLQCYRPDVQNKTCQSIASYRRTGPGTYDNKAVLPISSDGPTTLETHTPVVVRNGAVCGQIRARDFMAGTLRVDGSAVPPEEAKPVLEAMAQAVRPFANKEICTRYEPSAGDLTAKITIAGKYQADQDEPVKWITDAEGYTVTR